MKIHTTNYYNTFIEVAEDSKASLGTPPPAKTKRTVAELQYELISKEPYKHTSDDILFQVFAFRNDLNREEHAQAKEDFFSKGQACLRASPLAKTYGFGIHFRKTGEVAIYGMETPEYQEFLDDKNIRKVKAMRSGK